MTISVEKTFLKDLGKIKDKSLLLTIKIQLQILTKLIRNQKSQI